MMENFSVEKIIDLVAFIIDLIGRFIVWYFKMLKEDPFKAYLALSGVFISIFLFEGIYNLYKFKRKPKKEKSIFID